MELPLLTIVFILACFIHYGVQKLFIHYKRFDDYNYRSSHKTLATRTGGIGIFLTVFIISLYFYFQGIELFDYSLFIPLGIMFVIGVYDDLYNADFKLKFLMQIIVAKIIIDQGYLISNYYGLFGLYELPWLLAQASTLFVFLLVVNAINFIDGIDGLAISEIIKIILIIEFFSQGFTNLLTLGLITVSAILPLYYFNFKEKGKVFLGDGGSMFLGTLIMIYTLHVLGDNYEFKTTKIFNKTIFIVLVLIYPLTDLLRVFILRIAKGNSPFIADKNHLHHVIFKRVKNHKKTLLLIFFFVTIIQLSIFTYIFYV